MLFSKEYTPLIEGQKWILSEVITSYYSDKGEDVSILSVKDTPLQDFEPIGYIVVFLVKKRYVFRYFIVFDENYHSGVEVGIGPCFVSPIHALGWEIGEQFSIDSSIEAVYKNLALLDKYVVGLDD